MTIVKHNLTQSENYGELASKATYFFTASKTTNKRFFDAYPSDGVNAGDVGSELVELYSGTDFEVWGVEEVEDDVTPLDFEEFDSPDSPVDPVDLESKEC